MSEGSRDLTAWMNEIRRDAGYRVTPDAPRLAVARPRCGHTAAQHAGQVRALLREREPALAAALATVSRETRPRAGWREDRDVPRFGAEEHIEAGWA